MGNATYENIGFGKSASTSHSLGRATNDSSYDANRIPFSKKTNKVKEKRQSKSNAKSNDCKEENEKVIRMCMKYMRKA